MKKWLFIDYLGGERAVFDTEKEAKKFFAQVNLLLAEREGVVYSTEEYDICEADYNPDPKTWFES